MLGHQRQKRSKSLAPQIEGLSYKATKEQSEANAPFDKAVDGAVILRTGFTAPKIAAHVPNLPTISKKEPESSGFLRHLVALLALSSIVLANMNRQAFNQALVSMTRTGARDKVTEPPIELITNPILDELTTLNPVNQVIAEVTTDQDIVELTTNPVISELTTNSAPVLEDAGYLSTTMSSSDELSGTEPALVDELSSEPPVGDKSDTFDWTGAQIGALQAAFSYGYTPFMIPGGRLSEIYGAKWIVFLSGFGSALCCLLSPFFADTDYRLLVASRVVMGFCQTGVSPALYALLTRWLPPSESSVYLPMIKVGVMVGFMLGSLVGGFLSWRLTFYVVGMIGGLWSLLWALIVSSDPDEHQLITKKELEYIKYQISLLHKDRRQSDGASRKAPAPWLNIFRHPVVIGFILTKFTVKLSTDAQTMQLPMYMRNVFHVSKELNGMLSAMNFAIQGVFTGLIAWLAKEFVVRQSFGLSKTGVRRLFQGINNFGMALSYILITLNMSSLYVVCGAVIFLSVTAMFGAGGEAVLPVDLSTDYSASIMAIANSAANFSGMILPSLVSFILADELGSSDRWNIVWWLLAAIVMFGGLAFITQVKAEILDFGPTKSSKKRDSSSKRSTSFEMQPKSSERIEDQQSSV